MSKQQYLKFLKFSVILSLLSGYGFSQNSTLSPYSRFGIGDLTFNGFSYQRGMGGVAIGYINPSTINFNNPASYASDTVTVMEIGANVEGLFSKQSTIHTKGLNADLNALAMAFPIVKNRVGLSFGIIPFSSTGYNIVSSAKLDSVTNVNFIYKGSGGYTKYYLGCGVNLTKSLSLGLNASYLFGNVINQRKEEFSNSILFNT
ncbi:MAG: hypothetical protein ACKOX3_11850, partial [Bacteroidota bacterium]